jgi:hypothetical protein
MEIKGIFRSSKKIKIGIFAILYHYYPQKKFHHYDILFEDFVSDSIKLITFNVRDLNFFRYPIETFIKRIKDHRRIYLFYEGKISLNRGRVIRIDIGRFLITKKNDSYIAFLSSRKINGFFVLKDLGDTWFIKKIK